MTTTRSIVGFGASSMQGVGDSHGGFLRRLAAHPDFASIRFHNAGIGGHTLADMLARTSAVEAHRPFELIVLLGCNDLPRRHDTTPERRTTLADYAIHLRELLTRLRAPRSLFISSFEVSEEKTGISPALFSTYMSEALSTASSLGYETWDLYAESRGAMPHHLATDGMHFNDTGHHFLATRITPWITTGASSV